MKKRNLIICGVAAVTLAFGGFALMACEPAEEADPPVITETVRYSDSTNPYKDVTWQEINTIVDWTEKATHLEDIYYQFEGSYSEAYQENYSRSFMVINCYKDGGLHGTFGNENYYGYWTNVDRRGNTLVSLHILRYQNNEYNNGVYDVICEDMSHDYFEYSSNMPIVMFGSQMRSCLISGAHYSPVTGLSVSGGQTACVVGDSFSRTGMNISVEHANGKSIQLDTQWYDNTVGNQANCPITFSGFDSSNKGKTEVTISYKNTEIKTSYECDVMGLKGISVDASKVKTVYHQGDNLDTTGLIVSATRDDDGISTVESRRYKVYGFDGNTEGEQTLTVKYDDKDEFTAEYKINVYGIDSIEVDAANAKKEYYVGDQVDKTGLVVKATFKDGGTDEIAVNRVEIKGFDSSAAVNSQTVTVEFQGLSKTYDVKIVAPEFTGPNNLKIKITTPNMCEFTSGGKTGNLAYTIANAAGKTIYNFKKPAEGTTGFTDEEFAALHKQYVLDKTDFSAAAVSVYEIAFTDQADRVATEVVINPSDAPGGNTEQRFIILDTEKGEATLTYKYWYANTTDTFVLKYTLENGVLTFTEQVSGQSHCGITFTKLQKTWILNDDFTASKPQAE